MQRYFAAMAGALMGLSAAGNAASAEPVFKATVTLDGVHYILPSADRDRTLVPRNPLCHEYIYAVYIILNRDLFYYGELLYQAKPGDHVVVGYPYDVQVNGHPVPRPPQPAVNEFRCKKKEDYQ